MKFIIFCSLIFYAISISAREWTDIKGRTLNAELLKIDRKHNEIIVKNNRQIRIPINLLSDKDRSFIMGLRDSSMIIKRIADRFYKIDSRFPSELKLKNGDHIDAYFWHQDLEPTAKKAWKELGNHFSTNKSFSSYANKSGRFSFDLFYSPSKFVGSGTFISHINTPIPYFYYHGENLKFDEASVELKEYENGQYIVFFYRLVPEVRHSNDNEIELCLVCEVKDEKLIIKFELIRTLDKNLTEKIDDSHYQVHNPDTISVDSLEIKNDELKLVYSYSYKTIDMLNYKTDKKFFRDVTITHDLRDQDNIIMGGNSSMVRYIKN